MRTKIVKQVQRMIDDNDLNKDIGNLSPGKTQNFTFNPSNLINTPDQTTRARRARRRKKSIVWQKVWFQHNRGKFFDFDSVSQFRVHSIAKNTEAINTDNGNFSDSQFSSNYNVMYASRVNVEKEVTLQLNIKATEASLSIFQSTSVLGVTKVFGSEGGAFPDSTVFVTLSKGMNAIAILYYREKAGGFIDISGDMGSYITSFIDPTAGIRRLPTIRRVKSRFVDGSSGSTVANTIEIDRIDAVENDISEGNIVSFNIYREEVEQLSYVAVSGWGTNSFVVDGDHVIDFPVAGTCIFDTKTSTRFVISGASYMRSGVLSGTDFTDQPDQTLINISGTLSVSPSNNTLFVPVLDRISNVKQANFSIVSGTDLDVVVGNTYSYAVTAINDSNNEGPFSPLTTVTAGDFDSPGIVTDLLASGTLKGVELIWTNPSDTDMKGIHIWDQRPVDLIISENFDDGTIGIFAAFGGPEIGEASTEQSRSPSYSFKVQETGPSFQGISWQHFSQGLEIGTEYRVSAWVYVSSGSASDVQISENNLSNSAQPTSTGVWEEISFLWTPTVVFGISVFLTARNSAIAYFDNFSIVKTETIINPVATLLKGTSDQVPNRFVATQTTSGTLLDATEYTFYVSTFDWASNEELSFAPAGTAETAVDIKTRRVGQRVEIDTETNQMRYFRDDDTEIIRIGEDIQGSLDGMGVFDGGHLIAVKTLDSSVPTPVIFTPIDSLTTIDGPNIANSTSFRYGATTGRIVRNSTSTTHPNTIVAGIRGQLDGTFELISGTMTAILGDVTTISPSDSNIYAGYFKNGPVFIEQDLIVSGTTKLSLLETEGPLTSAIETVTTDTTLDNTHGTILSDATSGNIVLELPTAASAYNAGTGVGRIYTSKKIDSSANLNIISGNSSDGALVDGADKATATTQYESITVQTNGTGWWIL